MRIAPVKEGIKNKDFDHLSIEKYKKVQPVGCGRIIIFNLNIFGSNGLSDLW